MTAATSLVTRTRRRMTQESTPPRRVKPTGLLGKPDGSSIFGSTAQRYLKRIQYGNRAAVMDRATPVPTGDDDYLFEVIFDYGEHVGPADLSATEVAEPNAANQWRGHPKPLPPDPTGF